MSLSKVQINRKDFQIKLLVFGYVRESVNKCALHTPDPLILIILAFFYLMESFQKTDGDGLEISEDGLSITRVSKDDGKKAYGIIDIDSNSDTLSIWKIKMNRRENTFMVGVMAIRTNDTIEWSSRRAQYMLFSQTTRSTLLCSGGAHLKLNDDIVKTGDIITIELDLNARKVTFSLNDKRFESKDLSNDISDNDMKYYLVCRVGKYGKLGHQMTIMDFIHLVLLKSNFLLNQKNPRKSLSNNGCSSNFSVFDFTILPGIFSKEYHQSRC